MPAKGDKGEILAEYDHSPFDVVCFWSLYDKYLHQKQDGYL